MTLYRNTVTIRTFTTVNQRGDQVRTATDATAQASVQPRSGSRQVVPVGPLGVITHVVYFAADPSVDVDDQILWDGRVLSVLAAARDQAGRGRVWAVDCREVT